MIFTLSKVREAKKKAIEDNGYFTAEMVTGYVASNYPVLFLLDVLVLPIVIAVLFCAFLGRS